MEPKYKCLGCGRAWEFKDIANDGMKKISKEEYLKLGGGRERVNFRCPECRSKMFTKARRGTKTVKAR